MGTEVQNLEISMQKSQNKTSRIHLVANATAQYNSLNDKDQDGHDVQWKWVGMHENMLMTTFETNHTELQHVMTRYWGYIKETPQVN